MLQLRTSLRSPCHLSVVWDRGSRSVVAGDEVWDHQVARRSALASNSPPTRVNTTDQVLQVSSSLVAASHAQATLFLSASSDSGSMLARLVTRDCDCARNVRVAASLLATCADLTPTGCVVTPVHSLLAPCNPATDTLDSNLTPVSLGLRSQDSTVGTHPQDQRLPASHPLRTALLPTALLPMAPLLTLLLRMPKLLRSSRATWQPLDRKRCAWASSARCTPSCRFS